LEVENEGDVFGEDVMGAGWRGCNRSCGCDSHCLSEWWLEAAVAGAWLVEKMRGDVGGEPTVQVEGVVHSGRVIV